MNNILDYDDSRQELIREFRQKAITLMVISAMCLLATVYLIPWLGMQVRAEEAPQWVTFVALIAALLEIGSLYAAIASYFGAKDPDRLAKHYWKILEAMIAAAAMTFLLGFFALPAALDVADAFSGTLLAGPLWLLFALAIVVTVILAGALLAIVLWLREALLAVQQN